MFFSMHVDLLKFDDTVYSLFPEDPSVSLLPGPADGAEHYLWKTDRETYLSREHQYLEVGSRRQERVKLESDEHSLRSQQVCILLYSLLTDVCSRAHASTV